LIESLSGTLEALSPEGAVVRLGGITLRIAVSHTTAQALGSPGAPVSLYTHLHLREDVIALYGFASVEERDLFLNLLKVNGVGPRLALAVCSLLTPPRLAQTIKDGDIDSLTRVPGIGKRLAGRLVLELRGHLAEREAPLPSPADSELLAALLSLGYTRGEAQHALASLGPDAHDLPFEERLRATLRSFIPHESI
jgi:Holliday junction DNA helicase RuvA